MVILGDYVTANLLKFPTHFSIFFADSNTVMFWVVSLIRVSLNYLNGILKFTMVAESLLRK